VAWILDGGQVSHLVDDTGKRKFVAVLHQDPVNSPESAVKAFIVSEYKKE